LVRSILPSAVRFNSYSLPSAVCSVLFCLWQFDLIHILCLRQFVLSYSAFGDFIPILCLRQLDLSPILCLRQLDLILILCLRQLDLIHILCHRQLDLIPILCLRQLDLIPIFCLRQLDLSPILCLRQFVQHLALLNIPAFGSKSTYPVISPSESVQSISKHAKIGFSNPTSTPTISKVSSRFLFDSSGEEIVSFMSASLLRTYVNFLF
jgi:hypothetical protein